MSRPVKMALLFIMTLVYVSLTWFLFKPPLTISYPWIWLWIISIFLILGVGFRVITNKFFGNFFFSYMMFGLAGFVFILFAGVKISSLPVFHKEEYAITAPIEIADFVDYSMTETDLALIPEHIAMEKAAKELALYMPDDLGFVLSQGYLQSVNDKFVYVFSLENEDKKTDSPGYVTVDAISGEVSLKKTSSPMKYSPYKKHKDENIMKQVYEMSGRIKTGMAHLEVDEEGNPYWVIYSYSPVVGIMGTNGVKEVFLCNPFTGDITKVSNGYLSNWVDYQFSLETFPKLFNESAKSQKLGFKIKEEPMLMPRGNQLFAYYNLQGKEGNAGVAFVNMKTMNTKVYPVDTIGSKRVMECLDSWSSSSGRSSVNMPILSNIDGHPAYVSAMFNETGTATSYLMLDAIGGSYYASGENWTETASKFASEVVMQQHETPSKPENEPSKDVGMNDPDGEGVTYNLIAGFVKDFSRDGNQYVVSLVAMKPKYYISVDLITDVELTQGKENGITLQYPIKYDGQTEVKDCIPVLNSSIISN